MIFFTSRKFGHYRSEMRLELDDCAKKKLDRMTELQTAYEKDIETICELCEKAEKFVQFGRTIPDPSDRNDAQNLIAQFR